MCLPLTIPANGQVTYANDTTPNYEFTTQATYVCDQDYALVEGNSIRSCGGDGSSSIGTWSGNEPRCERKHHYCLIGFFDKGT